MKIGRSENHRSRAGGRQVDRDDAAKQEYMTRQTQTLLSNDLLLHEKRKK